MCYARAMALGAPLAPGSNGLFSLAWATYGIYPYLDIVRAIKNNTIGWTYGWDVISKGSFAVNSNPSHLETTQLPIFYSYESVESVGVKTNFIKNSNLGGIHIYEIGYDTVVAIDPTLGPSYSLLEAAANVLNTVNQSLLATPCIQSQTYCNLDCQSLTVRPNSTGFVPDAYQGLVTSCTNNGTIALTFVGGPR